jgi:hypothetical protein
MDVASTAAKSIFSIVCSLPRCYALSDFVQKLWLSFQQVKTLFRKLVKVKGHEVFAGFRQVRLRMARSSGVDFASIFNVQLPPSRRKEEADGQT